MALESGTYISDLNANNPVNATDVVGEGDDHLRLIKATLLNTFPNVTGAVSLTHAQLNDAALKSATNNFTGANTFTNNNTDHLTLTRNSSDFGPRIRFGNNDGPKGYLVIDDAGAFAFADSGGVERFKVTAAGQLSVGDIPWSRLSSIPAFGTRWPTWSEVTSKPNVATLDTVQTISGLKTIEAASGNSELIIQKATATGQANIAFKQEGGFDRFRFGLTGATDDDFYLARYNDSGAYQDLPLSIDSDTGITTFGKNTRTHYAGADMADWWRTNASVNAGRWLWQIGAGGQFFLLGLTDAGSAGDVAMQLTRSGSDVPSVQLYADNTAQLLTQLNTGANATSGAQIRHADGSLYDVGMNVQPVAEINGGDITLGKSNAGKCIRKFDTSARTINIPASTDTVPNGSTWNYAGWNPGVVTLSPGAGVTLTWFDGSTTPKTGTRTFSQGTVATIVRMDSTRWFVWGNGGIS